MNRIKIARYGIGMSLVVIGIAMIVYGEIHLDIHYLCPVNGCNFSPEVKFKLIILPTILFYLGVGLMITGGIFMIINRKLEF